MRAVLIIVGAGILVAFGSYLGYSWMAPEARSLRSAEPHSNALMTEMAILSQEVSILRTQLLAIEQKIDLRIASHPPEVHTSQTDDEGIEYRVGELEKSLDELTKSGSGIANPNDEIERARLRTLMTSVSHSSEYRPSEAGEIAFENDAGKPMGSNSDDVTDVFLAMSDSVQLSGVECRKSVCKVTYSVLQNSVSETTAFDDPSTEIEKHLVESFDGADLDINYAKGPDGEEVMYIQLM